MEVTTTVAAEPTPQLEGLGTSLEEIQDLAREEGEVNIVQWPGYAQLTDEFTAATGCAVNTKDGASSDDMISLHPDRVPTTASLRRATRASAS